MSDRWTRRVDGIDCTAFTFHNGQVRIVRSGGKSGRRFDHLLRAFVTFP